jgi:hypothetical protein
MTGCASLGGCADSTANGGAGCYLCDVVAKLPQPKTALDLISDREQKNATRGGAEKLSGERTRGNIAFRKRHRQGPHRGNA